MTSNEEREVLAALLRENGSAPTRTMSLKAADTAIKWQAARQQQVCLAVILLESII